VIDDVFCGLDLGTTRFRAVVAEPDGHGGVAILGHASVPARGLRRAELADLPAAASAIRSVLERAGDEAELDVDRCSVSIGGDHVRCVDGRSTVTLAGRGSTVRGAHLDEALTNVKSVDVPFDRVILHCLPVEYSLDERLGLHDPTGMVGARLGLEAHLVTGHQSSVSDLVQAVEMAGVQADPLVFAPCATSSYLLTPEEKRQGCLLVDIGGEVTHYALFHRGQMRQSGVVPVGGNHVTRDLAYGMGCDLPRAEAIKRDWGSALRHRRRGSELVAAGAPADEDHSRIVAICEARQLETMELVASGLQWGITRPALSAGIVLTGGGSRLDGTAELAEQVFSLRSEVRRAPGDDYDGEPDSWATVLGLVDHDLRERAQRPAVETGWHRQERLLGNVKRWIQRIV
jgi:cell division protein FtsA